VFVGDGSAVLSFGGANLAAQRRTGSFVLAAGQGSEFVLAIRAGVLTVDETDEISFGDVV
jgi:hypothetical protein